MCDSVSFAIIWVKLYRHFNLDAHVFVSHHWMKNRFYHVWNMSSSRKGLYERFLHEFFHIFPSSNFSFFLQSTDWKRPMMVKRHWLNWPAVICVKYWMFFKVHGWHTRISPRKMFICALVIQPRTISNRLWIGLCRSNRFKNAMKVSLPQMHKMNFNDCLRVYFNVKFLL